MFGKLDDDDDQLLGNRSLHLCDGHSYLIPRAPETIECRPATQKFDIYLGP